MKCEHRRSFFQNSKQEREIESSSAAALKKRSKQASPVVMPFDSPAQEYSQDYVHPYQFGYHGYTHFKPDSSLKENESWACDYCRVASFTTFKEASDHEQICPFNRSQTQNSFSHDARVPVATPSLGGFHHPIKQQQHAHSQSARLLLSMPGDEHSLSDRQCYVRSNFVEIFEAGEMEVGARHSKGAQKLRKGQVGIRCIHCLNMFGKQRAERAICYPSSVSRIYQTVADMQRFHFENCTGISVEMKARFKILKTTRPRGQGSPQEYWISSAKEIGLVDTDCGIRLVTKEPRSQHFGHHINLSPPSATTSSLSSFGSNEGSGTASPERMSPITKPCLPRLSPESQQTTRQVSDCDMSDRESDQQASCSDANMLLALRGSCERTVHRVSAPSPRIKRRSHFRL